MKKTSEWIRNARNSFGAHIDWTFNEVRKSIDDIGLNRIMHYAKSVVMFQDAICKTIPHRYYKPTNDKRCSGDITFPKSDEKEKMKQKYAKSDLEVRC